MSAFYKYRTHTHRAVSLGLDDICPC